MGNNIKRAAATAAITAALAAAAAAPAYAVIEYVGGGVWDHGFKGTFGGTVYSSYYHGGCGHSATAVGDDVVRDYAPKGYTAYAEVSSAAWGNATYWNRCVSS
ncbi:lactococcin 972 family bacteriocin [Nocardiopsis sp. LOL_012]|uniref:lactococcin 972 family bacteriocin n=1 Tax=Nocardiopsis sp. LOL_012 TaxID=3345409 RepID=UPI003A890291